MNNACNGRSPSLPEGIADFRNAYICRTGVGGMRVRRLSHIGIPVEMKFYLGVLHVLHRMYVTYLEGVINRIQFCNTHRLNRRL